MQLDELFFSTTDRKGIIRSGNEVFSRVAGYPRDALNGKPHNVIRHPDMPRAVFRLLWGELQAGRAVTAFVKNRASDGSHYWVLATVDQAPDGYVSVRMAPSSEMFEAVEAIYKDVLAVEQETEGGDLRQRKASIEAGSRRLEERLAEAGFADYLAFTNKALLVEVEARETALGISAGERLGTPPAGADPRLAAILGACADTHRMLDDIGANLEQYANLHASLTLKSAYVRELADDVRLFSLNALIGTTRLGDRGAALGAVADIMRGHSDTVGPVTDALSADIAGAVGLPAEMGTRIALSKLQTEMMMVFVRELIERPKDAEAEADLRILANGIDAGVRRVCASLGDLGRHLAGLQDNAVRLRSELGVLRRLEVYGRIEATRLDDAAQILELFCTIGRQVDTAHEQLTDFDVVDGRHVRVDDGLRRRMLDGLGTLEDRLVLLDA